MPQRRLALYGYEAGEVLNVENGLGGVDDSPDDDGGDLHGIAAAVVDLDGLPIEVVGPQGNLLLDEQGVGPVESAVFDRSGVTAEEDQDRGDVGLKSKEPAAEEGPYEHGHRSAGNVPAAGRSPWHLVPPKSDGDTGHQEGGGHRPTAYRPTNSLLGLHFESSFAYISLIYHNDSDSASGLKYRGDKNLRVGEPGRP